MQPCMQAVNLLHMSQVCQFKQLLRGLIW